MRIILIGYGVVGQSLTDLLSKRRGELIRDYGINPKVVAVVDRGGAAVNSEGLDLEELLRVKKEKGTVATFTNYGHVGMSAFDVIENVEAEVVVEVTPTNVETGEPGMSHIKAALRNKRHVVTTNKGPLALALPAFLELAEYNDVLLRFSGAVGGGTPILDLAKRCLLGDEILSFRGILNGTTNFILTKMEEEWIAFEQALKEAQRLGYAEADPSMDVDGIDSACKLVIMANWIMGRKVTLSDVRYRGIRDVTLEDIRRADSRGSSIRLLASANEDLIVEPTDISKDDPLCVRGALNAVTFVSKFAGEETIIGPGAGGTPTASAILRDLLEIKRAFLGVVG